MTENRGANRGSYIWGRSVHNTRIERLWYDVTKNFGKKWKNFFRDLELNDSLNVDNPVHLWLLHYLFLSAVNQDAEIWARAWNVHKLKLSGVRDRTPTDMFLLGMVEHGLRGFEPVDDLAPEDLAVYGVDFEVLDDRVLMQHHFEQQEVPQGFFAEDAHPDHMADIQFEPPNCPFSPENLQLLAGLLEQTGVLQTTDMHARRWLWTYALQIVTHF
ncbi:hypothetical protein SISSUDRAFT_994648 [Sistotremastrum suecicum HHB10207 ss-3]|uniref:Integrase core domain-containing protein n=1 Tax=Sistotremastrum suecicum HHB10207 ss-3 TaxID=1314776 RepID=A0A165X5S4_9AGAM|nr:hypothetical protein SISSUDRAFT_994648 [Sistotremastrum suecicum HHB10207 ss-3]